MKSHHTYGRFRAKVKLKPGIVSISNIITPGTLPSAGQVSVYRFGCGIISVLIAGRTGISDRDWLSSSYSEKIVRYS
jgi:hypothetical protein